MAQIIDADALLASQAAPKSQPIDADALLASQASKAQGDQATKEAEFHQQLRDSLIGLLPGGALINHPGLLPAVGGVVGTGIGVAGGPVGMAGGGALGGAAGGAAEKLVHTVKGDEPPTSATETASDIGTDAGWGLLGGAGAAGTLKGAPTILRAMAHPVGQAIVAGSLTYKATGSIERALEAAAVASVIGARGRGKALTTAAGKVGDFIEGLGAKAAPAAEAEIPQVISSGVKATPPLDLPPAAPSASVQQGFRMNVPNAPVPVPASAPAAVKAAVESAPSELDVLKGQVAKDYAKHPELRDLILKKLDEEVPEAATKVKVLPDGTRAMPAYQHGVAGQKTPSNAVPSTNDVYLEHFKQSLDNPGQTPPRWSTPPNRAAVPGLPNSVTKADNLLGDIIQWKNSGKSDSAIIDLMKSQHGIAKPQAELALSRVNDTWAEIMRNETGQMGSSNRSNLSATLAERQRALLGNRPNPFAIGE